MASRHHTLRRPASPLSLKKSPLERLAQLVSPCVQTLMCLTALSLITSETLISTVAAQEPSARVIREMSPAYPQEAVRAAVTAS